MKKECIKFLNKKSYVIYYFGFMEFIDYKLIM